MKSTFHTVYSPVKTRKHALSRRLDSCSARPKLWLGRHCGIAALVAASFMPHAVQATTVTWDANSTASGVTDGGGTWSTGTATWWNSTTDVVWATGYDAVIGNGNGTAGTITVSGSVGANSLTFNTPTSGNYTVTGGTIGLAAGGMTVNSGATIGSQIVLTGNNTWTVASGQTLTLTGSVANGANTLALAGAGNVTAAAALTVNAASTLSGTLSVFNGATTGTGAGTFANISGLVVTGGTLISGAAADTLGTVNRFNTAAPLSLGGAYGAGVFTLTKPAGTASQTFANLSLGAGLSVINNTNGAGTLTFAGAAGAGYKRSAGGFINFGLNTASFTNAPTAAGGSTVAGVTAPILIGAILNGADFVAAGSGNVSAATYSNDTYATGVNTNVTLTAPSLATSTTTQSIRFNAASNATLTISSGQTLTVESGGIFQAAANYATISGGTIQALSGQELWITGANNKNVTINSSIADNGTTALGVNGAFTLSLGGSNAFAGPIYLTGGAILNLNNASALGAGTANINVLGSTTLMSWLSGASTNRNISIFGGQTLTLNTNGYDLTLGGTIASVVAPNAAATSLVKSGNGLLTLNGASVYTGTTTISGGVLQANNSAALGNGGNITFSGGVLQFTSASAGQDWSTRFKSSSSAIALDSNGQTVTLAGVIDNSDTGGLIKSGVGTLILNGVNTYSGITTVSSGTLQVGNALALQNSFVDTSSAGTFTFNGIITPTVGGIIGSTDLSNVLTTGYSSVTALTLNPGTNVAYSGVIANGSMALAKSGAGTQILSGTNSYTGVTTITAGVLSVGSMANGGANSGIGAASAAAANLVFNGGTLQYTGTTVSIDRAFTINTGKTATIDVTNGLTLAGATGAASNGGFIKAGAGTLIVTGANTYTGTTTVSNGVLQVGNGTTGSLNGSTGTALTFNGAGGTLNVQEAAGSTQSMSALTFSAADGAIVSTAAGASSSATLTFASLAARTAGATGNFSLATNSTAGQNKITLSSTANAPVSGAGSNNSGLFFGGVDYARYDTVAGYFRAATYGTDNNASPLVGASTTLGISDATKDVKMTGNITAQTTASVNTLNLGASNLTLADATQILSVNGILSSGASTATIATTGTLQGTAAGNEIVIRVNGSSDKLTIAPAIQNYAGGGTASMLTKSGAGTLVLTASNSYTGATVISGGTLQLGTGVAGQDGSVAGAITDNGALAFNFAGSPTYSGVISGLGSVTFTGNGGNTLTLGGNNTFTGGLTIAYGTVVMNSDGAAGPQNGNATVNSGVLSINGKLPKLGNLTLNSGTVGIGGNGNFVYSGSFTSTGASATYSSEFDYSNSTAPATFNVISGTLTSALNNYWNCGGSWGSSGRNLQGIAKSGTGTMVVWVANANGTVFAGPVALNGGVYSVDRLLATGTAGTAVACGNPLGASSNAASNLILNGGTLQYTGGSNNITDRLFSVGINGGGLDASGSVALSFTNTGTIGYNNQTGARTLTLSGTNTGANTLAVAIGDNSGATSLIKAGSGTWVLTGTNTFSGGVALKTGTLKIDNNNAVLGSGTFQIGDGTGTTAVAVDSLSARSIANGLSIYQDFTYAGTNTLTQGTGAITLATNGVTGTHQITVNASTLTLGGNIGDGGGAYGLTKTGAGTLILSGSNTFSGVTTIGAGTLQIGTGSTTGLLSAGGAIVDNGALVFNRSNAVVQGIDFSGSAISGSGSLTQAGSGLLLLTASNSYTGTTTISSGTLQMGMGAAGKDGSVAGNITDNAALAFNFAASGTYNGNISGTGGVTVTGAALTLGGASSFSGGMTISSGTVVMGNNQAAGQNGSLTVSNGLLNLGGKLPTFTGINLNNGSISGGNMVVSGVITSSGTSSISLPGGDQLDYSSTTVPATYNVTGGTLTSSLAGYWNCGGSWGSSGANPLGLVKNGSGTMVVSVVQSNGIAFTGPVVLNGGIYSVDRLFATGTGAAGATGNPLGVSSNAATNLVLNGGTLQFTGGSVLINSTAPNNTDRLFTLGMNGGALDASGSAALTFSNTGSIGYNGSGARTLTLTGANTGANTLAAAIGDADVSSPTSLTKSGAGTWVLSGVNTYSGATTVNGGTLQATGAQALPGSSAAGKVTVGNGGALVVNYGGGADWASAQIDSLLAANAGGFAAGSVFGFDTTNLSGTYNSSISGAMGITKLGANTLTLGGSNSFSGPVTINAGTLQLGSASALNSTPGSENTVAFGAGSTGSLSLNGNSLTIASLSTNAMQGTAIVQNANGTAATLTIGNSANLSGAFAGAIQDGAGGGALSVVIAGAGTQVFSGSNTYSGGTTINSGILQLGTGVAGQDGSITGNVANNAALVFNVAGNPTFSNAISGAGSITKTGAGILTLSGSNSYSGGIAVGSGILVYANSNAMSAAGTTTVAAAGGLALGVGGVGYFSSTDVDNLFAGSLSGVSLSPSSTIGIDTSAGDFTYASNVPASTTQGFAKIGANTLFVTGINSYTGVTTLAGGVLNLGSAESVGVSGPLGASAALNPGSIVFTGGTLQYSAVNQNDYSGRFSPAGGQAVSIDTNGQNINFATALSGSGSTLTKSGAGTLTLSASSSYTGSTAINSGTLQLGTGLAGQDGSVAGNIANNATLALATAGSATLAGSIGGSGNVIKTGGGIVTLAGPLSYAGSTTVNSGTLQVSGQTYMNVGRTTTISAGAVLDLYNSNNALTALMPVSTISGGGTFRLSGSSSLSQSSNGSSQTRLTIAMSAGGLIDLQGTSTLLNGGWGEFSWTTNQASLNLASGAKLDIWDGATVYVDALTGSGTVDKGSGGPNTLTVGVAGGSGTFSGIVKNTSGALSFTKTGAGTQVFTGSNSYTGATTVTGGTLQIGSGVAGQDGSIVSNVADNATLAFNTAGSGTYAGVLSGTGTLIKTGGGVLGLAGSNSAFTGAIAVQSGTLVGTLPYYAFGVYSPVTISPGATLALAYGNENAGSLSGSGGTVSLGGYQLFVGVMNTNATFGGVISGIGGSLYKQGTGAQTLTGANTYTGVTTLAGGVLNLGSAEIAGVSGPLGASAAANPGSIVLTGGTLQYSAANQFDYSGRFSTAGGQAINIDTNGQNVTFATALTSSTGTLNKAGMGTLTLSASNSYSGVTTISAGTLQLGTGVAGQDGWVVGNIANNGALALNLAGSGSYNGVISGTGAVSFTGNGSNTLTLGGNNTFSGGMTINSGTVVMNTNQAVGTNGSVTVNNGVLNINGKLPEPTNIILNNGVFGPNNSGNTAFTGTVTSTGASSINDSTFNYNGASAPATFNVISGTLTTYLNNAWCLPGWNGSGPGILGLTKNGGGTMVVPVTNNGGTVFSGPVTLNGGVYSVDRLFATGTGAAANTGNPLGCSSNAATNLTLNGGTLQFTGGSTVINSLAVNNTDRLFSLGANGGALDASGSAPLTFRNTGPIGYNGQTGARTLTLTGSNTGANTLAVAIGDADGLSPTSVTKAGAGTWVLTGFNTYSGATAVNGGTLQATGAQALPGSGAAGEVTVGNGATLTVNYGGASDWTSTQMDALLAANASGFSAGSTLGFNTTNLSGTYSSSIGGSYGISKLGTNTLVLGGSNTYTGPTSIASGTLMIADPGSLGGGTYAGAISNAGAFVYNSSASQVLSGPISGTGALTQSGPGTLTLTGSAGYTGATTVSSGTLVFASSGAQTLSGAVSGSGSLISNSGTLAFSNYGVGVGGTLTTSIGSDLVLANLTSSINAAALVVNGTTELNNSGAGALNLNAAPIAITGAGTLIKSGTGSLLISGYQKNPVIAMTGGLIVVKGGTLRNDWGANVSWSGNRASLEVDAGATFDIWDANVTVDALTGAGTITKGYSGGAYNLTIGANNGSGTFTGVLSSTNPLALIKIGTGTQILTGSSSYPGGTTINAGTLQLGTGVAGQDGSITGNVVDNATLAFNLAGSGSYNGVISGTGAVTFTGTGSNALTLGGTNTFSGGMTITSGSVIMNSDQAVGFHGPVTINNGLLNVNGKLPLPTNITLNNGVFGTGYNGNVAFTGSITSTGSSSIFPYSFAYNGASAPATFNVVNGTLTTYIDSIWCAPAWGGTGSGIYGLTKNGSGTMVVSSYNSIGTVFSGPVTLNAGVYSVDCLLATGTGTAANTGNSLGVSSNAATNLILNGGTLQFTGSSANSTDRLFSLGINGGGLDASGSAPLAFTNTGAIGYNGQTGARTLTLTGTNTGANKLASTIGNADGSSPTGVTKSGAGTWVLTAANTYSGNTTANNGTLVLAHGLAVQNSTVSINAGTVAFDSSVGTHAFVAGALSGTGNLALQDNAGTPNAVALTAGGNNASTVYSGALSGGGSLVKTGAGTLTLSGSSTYSGGTTVNSGTLKIAGDTSLGAVAGSVTLHDSATLQTSASFGFDAGRKFVVSSGTAAIDTQGNTNTVNGALSGAGTLKKSGNGTLILSGSVGIAGINASNGTVELAQSASIDAMDVAAGATVSVAANSDGNRNVLNISALTISGFTATLASANSTAAAATASTVLNAEALAGGANDALLSAAGQSQSGSVAAESVVEPVSPEAVPEPGALGLLLAGAVGLAGLRRQGRCRR